MGKTRKARGPLDCPPGISKAFIQQEKLARKFKRGKGVEKWRIMFGKIAKKWGSMSPTARNAYWESGCYKTKGTPGLRSRYKPKTKGVKKPKGKGKKKAKSSKRRKIGSTQVGRSWIETNCGEDALGIMKSKKMRGAGKSFVDKYCFDDDAKKAYAKRMKSRRARLGGCGCEACKRLGGCPCEACQRLGGCACVRGYGPSCK